MVELGFCHLARELLAGGSGASTWCRAKGEQMNSTNEQVVKPVSTSRTRKRFNFDRHQRLLIVHGSWHNTKEAHEAGLITDDEILARGQGLLAELAEIEKIPKYETVTVGVGWTPSHQTSWFVWQKGDGRCTYCNVKLNPFDRFAPNGFHVDHVNPRSKGGSDELDNLTASCRACNLSKSDRTPEE